MATENVWDLWGDASTDKSEGGGRYKRPWRLQEGDNIFGFLPPMGSLREDRRGWRRFHRVHWGYQMPRRDDPTKGFRFTFHCVAEKDRNGKIVVPCPQCERYEAVNDAFEKRKSELIAAKKSEDEIKIQLQPVASWLKDFRPEGKWFLNAINAAGEFGFVGISHKTFKQFEDELEGLRSRLPNVNPFSPKSLVMWNIKRVGNAKNVGSMSEVVKPAMEAVTMNGQVYERIQVRQLTEQQAYKALEDCVDLADIDVLRLTVDQVARLVATDGDMVKVAEVIKEAESNRRVATPGGVAVRAPQPPAPAPVPAPAAPAAAPPLPVAAPAPAAFVAPPPVAEASQPSPPAAAPAAPSVPASTGGEMSDKELFATLGIDPGMLGLGK